MSIYRTGTASLDANGAVVGVGTQWKQPLSLIRVGATVMFLSGSKPVLGSIAEIISDTQMSLIGTGGETAANGVYTILLNDALTVDGLAQDVAETLRYYQSQETNIAEIIELIEGTDLENLIAQMNQIKADTQAIQDAAQDNEDKSKQWASNPENSVVENGLYSSLHYSRKSAASATASEGSNQASLGHANDSDASAQDSADSAAASLASQNAAKTSETNAKTSENNAKASENLINQALSGTIKSRGRPSEAGFTDINAMGNEADVGQWQLDNPANYNLPNVPEAQPGLLEVAMGGRFARIQIYTGNYGSIFIRCLNSAWVAATPDWMPWRNVGANYTRIDNLDVNTLFNAALLYGTGVVNAPAGTGNQYCFIKVEAYGTSPVKQTLTWGTVNREFVRTYASGAWSDWIEYVRMDLNGITKILRGVDSTFSAQTSFAVMISVASAPANGTTTEGGLVRSSLNGQSGELGGVDWKYRHVVSSTGVVTKFGVLKVTGASGEVTISEAGALAATRFVSPVIAVTSGAYELNFTNSGNGTIAVNRTSNVTTMSYGGLALSSVGSLSATGSVAINSTGAYFYNQSTPATESNGNQSNNGLRIAGSSSPWDLYLQYYLVTGSYHEFRMIQNGAATFEVRSNGQAYAASFNPTSDSRLKFNKEFLTNSLENAMTVRGMSYNMQGERKAGVILQDVEKFMPEAVTTGSSAVVLESGEVIEDPKSMDYAALTALHTEALKDVVKLMLECLTDPESAKAKLVSLVDKINTDESDKNETDLKMEWALVEQPEQKEEE